MNTSVQRDMQFSTSEIDRVWSVIGPKLGDGILLSCENSNDPIAKHLDVACGIDYIQVTPLNNTYTIASRIQRGGNWATFTIRLHRTDTHAETEYAKRMRAIRLDAVYPQWTIQAYLTDTKTTVAAVETKNMYQALQRYPDLLHSNYSDNAEFLTVYWHELREHGVRVIEEVQPYIVV